MLYTVKGVKRTLNTLIRVIEWYEEVSKLHDCNDCGKKSICMYAPKPGESVRINCPLWRQDELKETTRTKLWDRD